MANIPLPLATRSNQIASLWNVSRGQSWPLTFAAHRRYIPIWVQPIDPMTPFARCVSALGATLLQLPCSRSCFPSIIAHGSRHITNTLKSTHRRFSSSPHITAHSPSFCLPTFDREIRSLAFRPAFDPPRLRSSSLSLAFGKFCAVYSLV